MAYLNRKPTRLLRILSDFQVQLVNSSDEASHKGLRYAALSYCWGFAPPKDTAMTGNPGELTRDEERMVGQGRTLRKNMESRYCELFAIKITRRLDDPQNGLELRYFCVDTLCIIQDDDQDKKVEIQRMYEVYGNVAVTICATGTAKATQPLLSATMAGHTAGNFLATCRAPEASELCLAWHDMVESYTARSLTNPDDHFHALAGLATRYLAATEGNKYIAGLWRDTFVQDLLWRVSQPARPSGLLTHQSRTAAAAPSWSWASLPIGLAVQMSHKFEMRAKIALLDHETQDGYDGTACLVVAPSGESCEDGHSAAVAEGGKVRRFRLQAPLRKLWRPGSQRRAWYQVCVHVEGVEKFQARTCTPSTGTRRACWRTRRASRRLSASWTMPNTRSWSTGASWTTSTA